MITQADSADPVARAAGELRKSLSFSPVIGSGASEHTPRLEWRAMSCS